MLASLIAYVVPSDMMKASSQDVRMDYLFSACRVEQKTSYQNIKLLCYCSNTVKRHYGTFLGERI